MPVIDADKAAFLAGPNSIALATHDGKLIPECTRALGLKHHLGTDLVTVWLPETTEGNLRRNLAAEPRIAVGVNRSTTHQTFQLKGRAVAIRTSPPERRAEQDVHWEAMVEDLAAVGVPRRLLQQVVRWPALEIDVEVTEIFDQTPGPGAGERCKVAGP